MNILNDSELRNIKRIGLDLEDLQEKAEVILIEAIKRSVGSPSSRRDTIISYRSNLYSQLRHAIISVNSIVEECTED